MKKLTNLTLLIALIVTIILPVQSVSASTINVTESQINLDITNWVLDEPSNTLYAVSITEKKLLFINAETLVVENSLSLNGSPTDIIKEEDKLYIALDDVNQIAIVDMATRKITKTLYTSSDPYKLAKNGNKLYYAERDQWCDIYEYDLVNNMDRKLATGSLSQPDIAINKEKNLLYIGESGSSGSNMIYYSVIEDKVISKSNYNNGYGFPSPSRDILFDGINVFYACRDFDADNATRIHGDFGKREVIKFVKDDLIYTSTSIYSKSTHMKIGESTSTMNLVEASSNTLYIYNNDTKSIKKFENEVSTINSNNIISLISGKETPKIQYNTESVKINTETYNLQMKSKLTEWVLDEASNTLYGISQVDKALFFINAKTLNIEKSITFTSSPTDIIKGENKLYIALDDANQIAIVDMVTRNTTEILYTSSDPYKIVNNGDKLYYTERDQWCSIYEYDLINNTDRKLTIESLYQPDIAINKEKNLLYLGESGSSGSDMIYYSIAEDKVISKSNYDNGHGFSYPQRSVLFDEKTVFYAGMNFKDDNATLILGKYNGDTIIYTTKDYVFTSRNIYDKNTYALIGSSNANLNLIEDSSTLDLYLYNEENGVITKKEPDTTAPVVEGVKNDSLYYGEVIINFNEGTATLDGNAFTSGGKVISLGVHALEVVDDAGNSTMVKFTVAELKKGDVNKDGSVNIIDYILLKKLVLSNSTVSGLTSADMNNDEKLNIFDIVMLKKILIS